MKKFVILLTIMGPGFFNMSMAKNLGYCPKDSAESCRSSLASALNVVTNCALDRPRTKECAFILVETLSEADHKAPFYEGFYEKNFQIGDVETYKKEVEDLHQYSPHAWHVLHNLSKALILFYLDIPTLSEEQKREVENLIQPVFEGIEERKFDINDPQHIKHFIEKQISLAKAIEWGTPKEKVILS